MLLPFWTSILVRTAAWTVLLQKFGILNELLLALHIIDQRVDLMYTRTGLIIAMTHIQLPFTLLPIYSIMRTISSTQMRAAYSLGARPFVAFRRVYLPQVMPGVMAGCLLTFILCLGYFITPALVGGPADQLIANFISNYINIDLKLADGGCAELHPAGVDAWLVCGVRSHVRRRPHETRLTMLLSPYATLGDGVRVVVLLTFCALVLAFLVLPVFVPVPLSVNSEAFFTYPLRGFSWRWYRDVLGSGQWRDAIWHSIVIAIGVTVLATSLGTLAAVGLSSPRMPARRSITAMLISPLIVPVIITAVGAYQFYAPIGLANSFAGIIIAQTTIAAPFVVVTVGASLANIDRTLMRAAAISGARPLVAFHRVMLPLILPGACCPARLLRLLLRSMSW